MILAINIGNTNTAAALCREGEVLEPVEVVDTAALLFGSMPAQLRNHPDLPCFAACVVPEAGALLKSCHPSPVAFIRADELAAPDFSRVDTATLGQDRIANLAGALSVVPPPLIVLDCGTALTTEVVDEDGSFRGGVIAPGRALLGRALHNNTAQLPDVPPSEGRPSALGANTRQAILGGVGLGVLGMARQLLEQTRIELGQADCPILVSGGDAAFFLEHLLLSGVKAAPAHLTLLGLAVIAQKTTDRILE